MNYHEQAIQEERDIEVAERMRKIKNRCLHVMSARVIRCLIMTGVKHPDLFMNGMLTLIKSDPDQMYRRMLWMYEKLTSAEFRAPTWNGI